MYLLINNLKSTIKYNIETNLIGKKKSEIFFWGKNK